MDQDYGQQRKAAGRNREKENGEKQETAGKKPGDDRWQI